MKKIIFLLCVFSLGISGAYAQKISLTKGNPAALKEVKEYKVEFDYSNIMVGKMTEEDYIAKKKAEYEKKGDLAKFETWKARWYSQRDSTFERKFIELFNDVAKKQGVVISETAETQYTMIVHSTFIEPGYNIGVTRMPASLNVEIKYVETADKSKVVCEFVSTGNPGQDAMGFDFDATFRIGEAYAKCGKAFAGKLYKLMWK